METEHGWWRRAVGESIGAEPGGALRLGCWTKEKPRADGGGAFGRRQERNTGRKSGLPWRRRRVLGEEDPQP
jgi:hypothetical protein